MNSGYYVTNRTVTIKGYGYAIGFTPGKPAYVPPLLRSTARQIGAVPDASDVEIVASGETVVDAQALAQEPGLSTGAPIETQVTQNDEAVLEAMSLLAAENNPDDFGASNKPHVKKIEALIGFDITAEQRDQLWQRRLEAVRT